MSPVFIWKNTVPIHLRPISSIYNQVYLPQLIISVDAY